MATKKKSDGMELMVIEQPATVNFESVKAVRLEPKSIVDIATLPNLYRGVAGRAAYVRMLQERLNTKGYHCDVSGVYSDQTAQAVQRFQNAKKLLPNAQVSQHEWRALTATN